MPRCGLCWSAGTPGFPEDNGVPAVGVTAGTGNRDAGGLLREDAGTAPLRGGVVRLRSLFSAHSQRLCDRSGHWRVGGRVVVRRGLHVA